MSIRMIAVDLDGTLLTDDKQISEVNRETLRKAASRSSNSSARRQLWKNIPIIWQQ